MHHRRPAGERGAAGRPGRRGPGRRRGSRWRRRAPRRSAVRRRASRSSRGRPLRRSPAGGRARASSSAPKPFVASSTAPARDLLAAVGCLGDDTRDLPSSVTTSTSVAGTIRSTRSSRRTRRTRSSSRRRARPARHRVAARRRVPGIAEVGDQRQVEGLVVGEPLDQPPAHVDQGTGDPLVEVAAGLGPDVVEEPLGRVVDVLLALPPAAGAGDHRGRHRGVVAGGEVLLPFDARVRRARAGRRAGRRRGRPRPPRRRGRGRRARSREPLDPGQHPQRERGRVDHVGTADAGARTSTAEQPLSTAVAGRSVTAAASASAQPTSSAMSSTLSESTIARPSVARP